jgi:N-acetylglucosaminyldiphosphoundecaprenol N-acetyl-beta-D-mannosaminyltransferase
VLPDGTLAVFGARRRGGLRPGASPARLRRGLPGAGGAEGISVFFLGTTEKTLALLVGACARRFPGLVVKGALAPPFGPIDDETDQRLVESVNRSGADALFAAMTAPKQELWLSRNRSALRPVFAMGVGAAFDVLAGVKKRVPPAVGQLGGEWLFRLVREPRRLWRRNLDSVVFLWLMLRERGR